MSHSPGPWTHKEIETGWGHAKHLTNGIFDANGKLVAETERDENVPILSNAWLLLGLCKWLRLLDTAPSSSIKSAILRKLFLHETQFTFGDQVPSEDAWNAWLEEKRQFVVRSIDDLITTIEAGDVYAPPMVNVPLSEERPSSSICPGCGVGPGDHLSNCKGRA